MDVCGEAQNLQIRKKIRLLTISNITKSIDFPWESSYNRSMPKLSHAHKSEITIAFAMSKYLETVRLARSLHTARTYGNALKVFRSVLLENDLDPTESPVSLLTEDGIAWMALHLKDYSPASEQVYLQSVMGFYKYLAAERLADINLPRLELLLKQRARRPGVRLPQFPADEIERLLEFVNEPILPESESANEQLRALRDRAFLLTLADTGLRVHEACKLRRGDIDWNEARAVIVGKGDKQAVIRFSTRSMHAIKAYLTLRAGLDGDSGKPLSALPIFARHDKGAGKKVKPITTATGRNIVSARVQQTLGKEAKGRITPHSFRHYFVTTVLRGSGNLKLAQELARHKNIQVTQRYAHLSDDELDKGYHEIFENRKEQE